MFRIVIFLGRATTDRIVWLYPFSKLWEFIKCLGARRHLRIQWEPIILITWLGPLHPHTLGFQDSLTGRKEGMGQNPFTEKVRSTEGEMRASPSKAYFANLSAVQNPYHNFDSLCQKLRPLEFMQLFLATHWLEHLKSKCQSHLN